MEPLPETCKFCGISSPWYCISSGDVQKCGNRSLAERRAADHEAWEQRRTRKRLRLRALCDAANERFENGRRFVRLSREDWDLLQSCLKHDWQII